MAHLQISGFDDVEKMFQILSSEVTDYAREAVDEGAALLETATRSAVSAAANRSDPKTGKAYATGALASSFSRTPAKENALGVYAVVRPTGGRDGHDNAERASWLEYGISHRLRDGHWTKQAPSPFRAKAVASAKSSCEEIAKKKIKELIQKAGGDG